MGKSGLRLQGRFLTRISLLSIFLVSITILACGPATTTSEPDFSTGPKPHVESDPALLLSEDSAISILQTFLQECVLSWDITYRDQLSEIARGIRLARLHGNTFEAPASTLVRPPPEHEQKWWMDLATGEIGDFVWSARHHGNTELPGNLKRAVAETWVIEGPGFERRGSNLEIRSGRWKVYAGHRVAYPLDASARVVLEEYKKPLGTQDPYCHGYSKR